MGECNGKTVGVEGAVLTCQALCDGKVSETAELVRELSL